MCHQAITQSIQAYKLFIDHYKQISLAFELNQNINKLKMPLKIFFLVYTYIMQSDQLSTVYGTAFSMKWLIN